MNQQDSLCFPLSRLPFWAPFRFVAGWLHGSFADPGRRPEVLKGRADEKVMRTAQARRRRQGFEMLDGAWPLGRRFSFCRTCSVEGKLWRFDSARSAAPGPSVKEGARTFFDMLCFSVAN